MIRDRSPTDVRSDERQPRSRAMLWLGILGPPVIWLTQFEIKYALAGTGKTDRHGGVILATGIVGAAFVILLCYLAGRERALHDQSPVDVAADVVERNRFMATLGLMSGALFLLVILAQLVADFYFPPGAS